MVGKRLALTLALLALAAVGSAKGKGDDIRKPPPPPRPPAPRLECAAIQVTSPQGLAAGGAFSVRRHYDLDLAVRLLPGEVQSDRVVRLKLYTPRGFLYQVLEAPAPAPALNKRSRRPVKPQETTTQSVRFPVVGTWITENTLYGRWRVVPYLGTSAQPCGREASFIIAR